MKDSFRWFCVTLILLLETVWYHKQSEWIQEKYSPDTHIINPTRLTYTYSFSIKEMA